MQCKDISTEHTAFREGQSCIDPVFTLQQIINELQQFNLPASRL
jgi:hypothetical protein